MNKSDEVVIYDFKTLQSDGFKGRGKNRTTFLSADC